MSIDLQAIRERAEKATKGPWRVADYTSKECPDAYWLDGPDFVEDGDYSLFNKKDAEFITNARQDVSVLLDYIKKLTEAAMQATFKKKVCKPAECKSCCGCDFGQLGVLISLQEEQRNED